MKALWWVAIVLALRSLLGPSHGSTRDWDHHESKGRHYNSHRRRERTRSSERYEYDGDAGEFEILSGLGETLFDLLGTETKSRSKSKSGQERRKGSRRGRGQEGRRRDSFTY